MAQNDKIQLFEDKRIRTAWDEEKEEWYFSIVDVVGVLTDSVDPTAYWRKPKQRLKAEGNEIVTNCHSLKMTASDGKTQLSQTKLYCAIGQMVSGRTEQAHLLKPRNNCKRPIRQPRAFLPAICAA